MTEQVRFDRVYGIGNTLLVYEYAEIIIFSLFLMLRYSFPSRNRSTMLFLAV